MGANDGLVCLGAAGARLGAGLAALLLAGTLALRRALIARGAAKGLALTPCLAFSLLALTLVWKVNKLGFKVHM